MNELSYCGYDCNKCPIKKATIENNIEEIKKIMNLDKERYINKKESLLLEEYGCMGCKNNTKNKMCGSCFIRSCNKQKDIESCAECYNFPCDYINKNLSLDSIEILENIKIEMKKKGNDEQ